MIFPHCLLSEREKTWSYLTKGSLKYFAEASLNYLNIIQLFRNYLSYFTEG